MVENDNNDSLPESNQNFRKLEAVPEKNELKNEKPSNKVTGREEDDHDLTRELLDLYQIPIRRRRQEGM